MLISLMSCGKAQVSGIGESVFEWEGIREGGSRGLWKIYCKVPFPQQRQLWVVCKLHDLEFSQEGANTV